MIKLKGRKYFIEKEKRKIVELILFRKALKLFELTKRKSP